MRFMKIWAWTPARRHWLLVALFAVGMAWVEAASVYYLRVMVDRIDPYQVNPLPIAGAIEQVELTREAATLVMLFTIGAIAGRTWRARLAYSAIAFGTWDIFYYVFLRLISGWPRSPLDWDILFLLPLPWWGPVWAPVCIAVLMIVWGTLVTLAAEGTVKHAASPIRSLWPTSWLGVGLALYVFMADSLRAAPRGLDLTRTVLPQEFKWPVFVLALTLMAAPVAQMGLSRSYRNRSASSRFR